MRILLTTNMIPSPQKPYGGIFVINQFKFLKKDKRISKIELFGIDRTFTRFIGSVIKYSKGFIRFTPHYFKKYDLVHVHYYYPFGLLAAAYKLLHPKTAVVATIHGTDVTSQITSRRNRYIFSKAARSLDYLIAVGNDIGAEAELKLNRKVDLILSAGVNTSVFYRIPGTPKKYDFVFAGSFIARKGLDILMEGIRKSGITTSRFCFLGSGEYQHMIEELSKKLPVDMFINLTQDQMRMVFNESRFIILPSREEPFGLVITEALYCGTPAIVAPIGGLLEQVQEGFNGFVLEENTPDAIAKTLHRALNMTPEDYSRMADNAASSNRQHSLEKICDRHVEIYQDLISKKNGTGNGNVKK
jgi:glycosyltransferase involved in cell wall biosynthesis